jgi:hypothetical protein
MSSIACFYRVSRADLDTGSGIAELLRDSPDLGRDYGWSGYVMLDLLTALEEIGVGLGTGLTERIDAGAESGVVFFATPADLGVIESLDLDQLDRESLGDDLGLDDDELREAVTESVTTLRQLIAGTGPDEVLVISIG